MKKEKLNVIYSFLYSERKHNNSKKINKDFK